MRQSKKALFVPSLEQLTDLVHEWQMRLRIADYDIAVSWVGVELMPNLGVVGCCQVSQGYKTAKIRFLKPECYSGIGEQYNYRNLEHTCVHELLHIYNDGLDIPKERTREEEQAINMIAAALVDAKYGVKYSVK